MKQLIFFMLLYAVLFMGACSNGHEGQGTPGSYYTCPMHPTVMSKAPGSCPVCNMSLIKVEMNQNLATEHGAGNYISIDKRRQELAGIKNDTAKFQNIFPTSTILGTVAIDEAQVKTIGSRAKGRIDKLFVKASGRAIQIGSPLYSIYSELLLADEKEYLALNKKTKATGNTSKLTNEMMRAAKTRLLLWGLSEKQISELEKSGEANPLITFSSTEAGYVTEVNIAEGMYVDEGSPLVKIISSNQVWVEAQLYANELSAVMQNQSFHVYSESNPNEIYKGTLVYHSPQIEEGRKVQLLRLRVDKANGKLIPGMMVSVSLQKTTKPVLAVPKSAILLEKMKTAWVKTGDNIFEQRMVETGTQNKYWIEIVSGLKAGEVIVTEGAYLINSEFILKSGAGQRHEH